LSNNTTKGSPFTSGRKPFKSPLKVNSESAPVTPVSSNGKRKRVFTGKTVPMSSSNISQMSSEQLKQEEEKWQTILKAKEEHLLEAKQQKEENDKKRGVTQAGNEDGRVAALADKWVRVCQEAIEALQGKTKDASIGQIIGHFGIDPKLVNYNEEVDGFI